MNRFLYLAIPVLGLSLITNTASAQGEIIAGDDDLGTVTLGVSSAISLLDNDVLDGVEPDPADVIIQEASGFSAIASDGTITIPVGAASSGIYQFDYVLREAGFPANFDVATITLIVQNNVETGDDDFGTIAAGTEYTTGSIISNDNINATEPSPYSVSFIDPLPEGFTYNDDGTITIASDVATGTYTFSYGVCENEVSPLEGVSYTPALECDTAIITITLDEPLPVTLTHLGAYKEVPAVVLNWITSSEKNNRGFEIERCADGNAWSTIGFANTQAQDGNSNEQLGYVYRDEQPMSVQSLYRLKQVDIDGKFAYSGIVKVEASDAKNSFAVYPNPTNGATTVVIPSEGKVTVTNVYGKIVKQSNMASGTILDLSSFANGLYNVTYDGQTIQLSKVQ